MTGAIAKINEFFPSYSVEIIQTGVTAINLMIVIGALIAGWLSSKYTKKALILTGLPLIAIGGSCGFFFHDTINLFYLWSLVIGTGFGLLMPTVSSLIVDYFEGSERNQLAGIQTSFVNGGGVILTFIGGLLAAIAWNFSYLVFLIAIPLIIIFALKLPSKKENYAEKPERHKIPKSVAYYFVTVTVFMLVYNAFPSNIALFLNENDLGHASYAGGANAVFMAGGVFFGFVFTKFSTRIGDYLFCVAHTMLVICYFSLCSAQSLVLVFIVAFVGGMSISMTMPQAIFSISLKIPPQLGVVVFSLITSVATNIATFFSPVVIDFLSKFAMEESDSVSRFTIAGFLALIFAIAQFIRLKVSRRPASVQSE